MSLGKSFGQLAYEAYGEHVGWVSVSGDQLPDWEDVRPGLRAAWEASAEAVARAEQGDEDETEYR